MTSQEFKVGEYVIDYSCIYQITAITPSKDSDDLISYLPILGTDKVYTATIPLSGFKKSGIRKLMNAKEISSLNKLLKLPINSDYVYDIRLVKDGFYSNILEQIVTPLKYLWKNGSLFPRGDQEMKEALLKRLCMEVQFVTKKPETTIRKQIENLLGC